MSLYSRNFAFLALAAVLSLSGCDKIKALRNKAHPPAPAPVAAAPAPATTSDEAPAVASGPATAHAADAGHGESVAAPARTTSAPAPAPRAINQNAVAIALCYHNIEDKGGMKALTITVGEFRKELQALKDNNFTVIKMQDFLAFRRGEKDIPAKSALITIDDGWISSYTNAWPVLKEFGYPFTIFIYVNYVGTGGKSLSWEQLAEMRDAGVDIQSHTYSHSSLKIPGGGVDRKTHDMVMKDVAALGRDGWLRKEIVESKLVLEKQLGIKCNAFAYPFGVYNQRARDFVKEAGYEAAFTVYGQQLRATTPPFDLLGRYAVEASKPQTFTAAMKMIGGGVSGPPPDAGGQVSAQIAAASMVTQPMEGETITDPHPLLRANLATMGEVEPGSVLMRVSGLGQVKAKYDATNKGIEYRITEQLHDPTYTVIISARVAGRPVETRWTFNYNGPGVMAAAPATPTPGAAPEAEPTKTKPGKKRAR